MPEEVTPGATRAVDQGLVARFAQFHSLNNVRCHTAIGFAACLVDGDPRNLAAPRALQNGSPEGYWGVPD